MRHHDLLHAHRIALMLLHRRQQLRLLLHGQAFQAEGVDEAAEAEWWHGHSAGGRGLGLRGHEGELGVVADGHGVVLGLGQDLAVGGFEYLILLHLEHLELVCLLLDQ